MTILLQEMNLAPLDGVKPETLKMQKIKLSDIF